MKKAGLCLQLFLTFLKIGAFTFGGGYAMIPLVTREAATNRGWIAQKDVLDIVAIAESTPGPIAVNSATFVGYKTAGFWGAVSATLGVVIPSFLIIFLIAGILQRFESMKPVKYAFIGIRAGVLALIAKALISMYRECPKSPFSYVIMGASFVCAAFFGVNALVIIIGCAVCGIAGAVIAKRRLGK